ncbi:MAG: hypothetical protein JJU02_10850, partial [Cryomorphaceae bacterium]|nr:hypothetical protein [Cryomorphaceae bacterium]
MFLGNFKENRPELRLLICELRVANDTTLRIFSELKFWIIGEIFNLLKLLMKNVKCGVERFSRLVFDFGKDV